MLDTGGQLLVFTHLESRGRPLDEANSPGLRQPQLSFFVPAQFGPIVTAEEKRRHPRIQDVRKQDREDAQSSKDPAGHGQDRKNLTDAEADQPPAKTPSR